MAICRSIRLPGIAALLASLVATPAVWGQAYKSDEIDQTLRKEGSVLKRYAADPVGEAAKKQQFESYIQKYSIPMMTRSETNALGEMGQLRFVLFRDYVWKANPTVQAWMTSTLAQRMKAIYNDPAYHPSVRYNALLTMGMLDKQYANESQSNRRPPEPLPEANAFLIQVLSSGLKDANVSPAMIVGSLIGLERHAKYRATLPQATQDTMAKGFVAVMGREKFPQEMSKEVRSWIRFQAASALAEMASVGDKGQYHAALVKLMDDPSLDVETRCQVAGLLAKLPYKAGDAIDGPATAKSFAQLAADYGADEAKIARKFEDVQIGVGGAGMFAAAGGAMHQGFRIVNGTLVYERRRPVACLTEMQAGMKAAGPALAADQQQVLQALQQAGKPVLDLAAKKDSFDLDLAKQIRLMAEEFNRIAPTAGAKAVDLGDKKPTGGIF